MFIRTQIVYAIQSKVINALKGIVENFYLVEYVTDGCAGQYKNFKSFSNIVYHFKDFNIVAIWTFFATAHGKSSCDGIGGNIKRCAANESLRRSPNEAIVSAAHMFEFCTKTFPSIIIEIVTAQDISNASLIVDKRELLSKTQYTEFTQVHRVTTTLNMLGMGRLAPKF